MTALSAERVEEAPADVGQDETDVSRLETKKEEAAAPQPRGEGGHRP